MRRDRKLVRLLLVVGIPSIAALAACGPLFGESDSPAPPTDNGADASLDDGGDEGTILMQPDGSHDAPKSPEAGDAGGCSASQIRCNGACIPNNTSNCGACGHDCSNLAHVSGTVSCVAEQCSFSAGACAPGFANCNGMADDGCEIDLSQPAHCGGCTAKCAADGGTPVCAPADDAGTSFGCASGCPASTPTLCDGTCVNPSTNAQNCMTCGHQCPSVTNGQPFCSASQCDFTCNLGFHKCGNACVDDTSINSCGTLCSPCPTPTNATAGCTNGKCGIGTCVGTGVFDCNADASDGCEANTTNDINNCNGCLNVCHAPASNGGATCIGSSCGIACDPGYHACGLTGCFADTDNTHRICFGVCTDVTTDPMNCGVCAKICGPGALRCVPPGTCVP